MNKTNKLLYGGFAAVVIAGIVALLVSVFSPPKQLAEETVEPPQTEPATQQTDSAEDEITMPEGAVAYYLDDNGNIVWLTQKDLDENIPPSKSEDAKNRNKRPKN